MALKINNEGDKLVAIVQGRLDTATSNVFATDIQPLLDNADKTIVLDCSELEFISSSGLRIFLNIRKEAIAKGGKVIIKDVQDNVKQVFKITGFLSLFDFE